MKKRLLSTLMILGLMTVVTGCGSSSDTVKRDYDITKCVTLGEYKGITKKVCIFILVAVGNIIDVYIIGSGASVRTMVIFFYLANEGISILENAALIGLPIPEKLREILKNMEDKET